ncbi:conserved Plasmodium protein, unknown function [Plasmodium gallinaceum]|uniref:Uncharacterized protein n=1 Tax=Plasmodium gallinaceum TaxID=5849 RepID=A0A1J1GW53_PLAGA|nr:conserved Plasmodium protein, unknown function [Plasmodium gallinaceum]CRG96494.1 conserved Plasmodium protein, unknown function [Plasmodium gallinaceum]
MNINYLEDNCNKFTSRNISYNSKIISLNNLRKILLDLDVIIDSSKLIIKNNEKFDIELINNINDSFVEKISNLLLDKKRNIIPEDELIDFVFLIMKERKENNSSKRENIENQLSISNNEVARCPIKNEVCALIQKINNFYSYFNENILEENISLIKSNKQNERNYKNTFEENETFKKNIINNNKNTIKESSKESEELQTQKITQHISEVQNFSKNILNISISEKESEEFKKYIEMRIDKKKLNEDKKNSYVNNKSEFNESITTIITEEKIVNNNRNIYNTINIKENEGSKKLNYVYNKKYVELSENEKERNNKNNDLNNLIHKIDENYEKKKKKKISENYSKNNAHNDLNYCNNINSNVYRNIKYNNDDNMNKNNIILSSNENYINNDEENILNNEKLAVSKDKVLKIDNKNKMKKNIKENELINKFNNHIYSKENDIIQELCYDKKLLHNDLNLSRDEITYNLSDIIEDKNSNSGFNKTSSHIECKSINSKKSISSNSSCQNVTIKNYKMKNCMNVENIDVRKKDILKKMNIKENKTNKNIQYDNGDKRDIIKRSLCDDIINNLKINETNSLEESNRIIFDSMEEFSIKKNNHYKSENKNFHELKEDDFIYDENKKCLLDPFENDLHKNHNIYEKQEWNENHLYNISLNCSSNNNQPNNKDKKKIYIKCNESMHIKKNESKNDNLCCNPQCNNLKSSFKLKEDHNVIKKDISKNYNELQDFKYNIKENNEILMKNQNNYFNSASISLENDIFVNKKKEKEDNHNSDIGYKTDQKDNQYLVLNYNRRKTDGETNQTDEVGSNKYTNKIDNIKLNMNNYRKIQNDVSENFNNDKDNDILQEYVDINYFSDKCVQNEENNNYSLKSDKYLYKEEKDSKKLNNYAKNENPTKKIEKLENECYNLGELAEHKKKRSIVKRNGINKLESIKDDFISNEDEKNYYKNDNNSYSTDYSLNEYNEKKNHSCNNIKKKLDNNYVNNNDDHNICINNLSPPCINEIYSIKKENYLDKNEMGKKKSLLNNKDISIELERYSSKEEYEISLKESDKYNNLIKDKNKENVFYDLKKKKKEGIVNKFNRNYSKKKTENNSRKLNNFKNIINEYNLNDKNELDSIYNENISDSIDDNMKNSIFVKTNENTFDQRDFLILKGKEEDNSRLQKWLSKVNSREKEKKKKIQEKKEEAQKKELVGCTFHPSLYTNKMKKTDITKKKEINIYNKEFFNMTDNFNKNNFYKGEENIALNNLNQLEKQNKNNSRSSSSSYATFNKKSSTLVNNFSCEDKKENYFNKNSNYRNMCSTIIINEIKKNNDQIGEITKKHRIDRNKILYWKGLKQNEELKKKKYELEKLKEEELKRECIFHPLINNNDKIYLSKLPRGYKKTVDRIKKGIEEKKRVNDFLEYRIPYNNMNGIEKTEVSPFSFDKGFYKVKIKPVYFETKIKISENKIASLAIREDEDPLYIVDIFCKIHAIKNEDKKILSEYILDELKKFHLKS